jgi:plastocyanin
MLQEIRAAALVSLLVMFATLVFAGCNYTESGYNTSSGTSAGSVSTVDSHMSHMEPAMQRSETGNAISANPNEVVIDNFSFKPAMLSVKAGTKVTWVNHDDEPHTATDDDKRFNSKTLDTNDQFSFTFTEPGTYNYFCALHPKMRGQIVVK